MYVCLVASWTILWRFDSDIDPGIAEIRNAGSTVLSNRCMVQMRLIRWQNPCHVIKRYDIGRLPLLEGLDCTLGPCKLNPGYARTPGIRKAGLDV